MNFCAMKYQSDYFPILGIQDFAEPQSQIWNLLFHELNGERRIDEAHKHDFFIINLFEKGKGKHIIDFVEFPIESHQIHLVFPGQVHQWTIEKETVGYQLMISREWFENFLPFLRFSPAFYFQHPVFQISEEIYELLLQEFQAIKMELNSEKIFWELIQKRSEVVGLLISQSAEHTFKDFKVYSTNPIISKFLNLIEIHFKTERSVSFYASELHISANYLNIVCKKNLNASASSLILNRVLLEAKRLLKISEMSIKDIVYDLGFYDQASFSKFFKTWTGMTPTEFKE